MKQVENYKDIEINGRTFRIKKFDARTGSFMLIKITGIISPMLEGINLNKLKDVKKASDVDLDAFNLPKIISKLGELSEKDFNYIQEKCLKVCSEVLPGDHAPVLREDGSFGAIGLEEDTMAILALTAHTLIFNVKGFFAGSPLASLLGGVLNTSQQN